jgi:Dehydrogenases with different specificities (related to short-chain alcohol dehydrogenases)
MNFKEKVCIVTGGSNGIGRCIADEFLIKGAKVAVADINDTGRKILEGKYNSSRFLFVKGDLTQERVLNDFHAQVLKKFGNVDYIINNASTNKKGILSGCNYADFNYVLKLGAAVPYMIVKLFKDSLNEGAAVVNISSTRAFMSQKDSESYTAAKGAITALTHALSISLAGKVRINSISPGWIDTGAYQNNEHYAPDFSEEDRKQHPAGRIGTPKDIAKAALFLCSAEAGFINGENIVIDGGMSKLMIYNNDDGWKYTL